MPFPEHYADGECAALATRLRAPLGRVGLDALQQHWRMLRFAVEARRPRDFDDGRDLVLRVRGAFGGGLMTLAEDPLWRALPRPPAHALLFRTVADRKPGAAIPKPYVVSASGAFDRLTIAVTLFGAAIYWATEAMEAMEMALHRGVPLGPDARVRARIVPDALATERCEGVVPLPRLLDRVTLVFRTPVAPRRGRYLASDGGAVLWSLAERIAGLARWQDLDLDIDWRALGQAIRALRIDSRLEPYGSERRSTRQPGREIPVRGFTGAIDIEGDLEPILPLLAIGQTCHAGSHAALGLGRFELALP